MKISASLLSAAVLFTPTFVSGLVWVGLMRAWVRSMAACSAASCEDILGKVSVSGSKSVVSETLFCSGLGM